MMFALNFVAVRCGLKFLLSHFVFARSLRSACSFDFFEAAPAKEVGEAGEKTPIFPAGKVAIWIAKQSAARQIYGCFEMVSPPRKQLYINRKVKFKIFAIPWFTLNL